MGVSQSVLIHMAQGNGSNIVQRTVEGILWSVEVGLRLFTSLQDAFECIFSQEILLHTFLELSNIIEVRIEKHLFS